MPQKNNHINISDHMSDCAFQIICWNKIITNTYTAHSFFASAIGENE